MARAHAHSCLDGPLSSNFVTEFNHAVRIGCDLREVECDVSIEFLKEGNPITYQNRHDRITNFVGQPKTKTFSGDDATSHEPDRAECRSQAPIHEVREIA